MVLSAPLLSRYSPAVAASARLTARGLSPADALAGVIGFLLPGPARWNALVTPRARQGLLAHYKDVRARHGAGEILLPVQVCPVVPAVLRAVGLTPRPLDADGALATPSPQAYVSALAKPNVIGVLIAPMGGYVQAGWGDLLPALGDRLDVTVDLAQAPLAAPVFGSDLLTRADAVLFSFGVGKGFDTGGGLLLSRHELRSSTTSPVRFAWPIVAEAALRSAMIRGVIALGLYKRLLPVVDSMAANDVEVFPEEQVSTSFARFWHARIPVMTSEFLRAGERSEELGRLSIVQETCRSVEATCSNSTRPLRQILRLRRRSNRDTVLAALRAAGLDCAPGGEPFPEGSDPAQWPAALEFTQDALRLPFLGRFTDREFARAKTIIEKVLVSHGV